MLLFTKNNLVGAFTQFWNDQSGQATAELAGWIAIATVIVYATVSYVVPGGAGDPTPSAKSEFNSLYANLSAL